MFLNHKRIFTLNLGGVILIGGYSGSEDLDTIYRLAHAEAQWEKMPQKLKIKRRDFVAFSIPEVFASCNIH